MACCNNNACAACNEDTRREYAKVDQRDFVEVFAKDNPGVLEDLALIEETEKLRAENQMLRKFLRLVARAFTLISGRMPTRERRRLAGNFAQRVWAFLEKK